MWREGLLETALGTRWECCFQQLSDLSPPYRVALNSTLEHATSELRPRAPPSSLAPSVASPELRPHVLPALSSAPKCRPRAPPPCVTLELGPERHLCSSAGRCPRGKARLVGMGWGWLLCPQVWGSWGGVQRMGANLGSCLRDKVSISPHFRDGGTMGLLLGTA
jgi:hypothetical protein